MSDTYHYKRVSGPAGQGSKVQVGIESVRLIGVPEDIAGLRDFLGEEVALACMVRGVTLEYQGFIRGFLAAHYQSLTPEEKEALPEFETKRSGKVVDMGKYREDLNAALIDWRPGQRSRKNGGQLMAEMRREKAAADARNAELEAQMAALQAQMAAMLEAQEAALTQTIKTAATKPKAKAKA